MDDQVIARIRTPSPVAVRPDEFHEGTVQRMLDAVSTGPVGGVVR